ncbi:MAG: DUF1493 family protein [Schleiferiaceae bacterium]|nr:DUF1493 family protein [Schleiferiaceae bacterium]
MRIIQSRIEEILEFVKSKTGIKEIDENTDLSDNAGIFGDDFDDLIRSYAERFNVDMSKYLWYFHQDEESSWSIGKMIFPPPRQVERIKITPAALDKFQFSGRWDIKYPIHQISKTRCDVLVDWGILLLIISVIFWFTLDN